MLEAELRKTDCVRPLKIDLRSTADIINDASNGTYDEACVLGTSNARAVHDPLSEAATVNSAKLNTRSRNGSGKRHSLERQVYQLLEWGSPINCRCVSSSNKLLFPTVQNLPASR